MRKLALVFVFALGLSGCAGLGDAIRIATTSVNNPITKETLYDVENGLRIAFAGLTVYKRSCRAGTLPIGQDTCDATIGKIQVYTRQLPFYLAQLRKFVKQNDQVNARVVYLSVLSLVDGFKAEATKNNVAIGAK